MHIIWILLLSAAAILSAILLLLLLYFVLSPMPVVRLLRRNLGDNLSVPPEYGEMKKKVDIFRDLSYTSGFKKNSFDLYLPKSGEQNPLVLWVHGGAFVAGDKIGVENWGVMLAANGYAAAVMNYEWAPEAAYPAQIMQIADALRTLAQSAPQNRIDMQRVILAGDSAGAHMAAQFVLLHTNQAFSAQIGIASPLSPSALRGALLYCGPYDLSAMFNIKKRILRLFISRIGWSYLGRKRWQKSPLAHTLTVSAHVTENFVPCYLTDGNTGSFESHARALGEALRKHGVETAERYFDLDTCGTVNHEYQMQLETENAQLCLNDTLDFLKKHLG